MAGPAQAQQTNTEPTRAMIYLAFEEQWEQRVVAAWEKKNPGKSVAYRIPLARLLPNMVIVPLVRGPQRLPVQYEEWDKDQHKNRIRTRDAATLVDELVECEPVSVRDYWSGDTRKVRKDAFSEIMGGNLETNAFIDAVNRSTLEQGVFARTHHGEDNAVLRLSWD